METASGKKRGPRPSGSDTREAILDAAREQFAEYGYRRTTMRGVAAAAGVDARLVTHYFGAKQDLFMQSVRLPIDHERHLACQGVSHHSAVKLRAPADASDNS